MSDFYATAFTPLVETFRAHFGLSVLGVTAIGAISGIVGPMMQPLLGIWSDRTDRGRMAAIGLAASAVFIGLIGLAPNSVALTLMLTGGALGVAAFHPSGAVLAVREEAKRGSTMALFMSGGSIGLALAPLASTGIVRGLGLPWLCLLALPGVALSVWLYTSSRGEPRGTARGNGLNWRALFEPGTGPLWALFGMAVVRSLAVVAFAFYLSVLGKHRGWDLGECGGILSGYLACGVLGSLLGGWLGERMDRRVLLAASCVLAAPFYFVFAATHAWVTVPAFCVAGFLFSLANPVNVVLAQELRPQSASMMSGVILGLAWGIASALLLAAGSLVEILSIERVLEGMAVVGALAAPFAALLPARRGRET